MAFEVMIGGVGDAFSLEHHGTHFFLRKDDFVLAIDCPDGYRRALKENNFPQKNATRLTVGDIDAMLITHLHGDHVNGLEMTAAYRRFVLHKDPLPIFGIPEVTRDLWPRRLAVSLGRMWNGETFKTLESEDYFEMNNLVWEASNSIGPFGIEIRKTVHHLPTIALRITDGDKTLGYSCDTIFDDELVDWLAKDSDLIFHESTFGAAHTPIQPLMELDLPVQKRMRIVHYPDEMVDMDLQDLQLARQGEVIFLE